MCSHWLRSSSVEKNSFEDLKTIKKVVKIQKLQWQDEFKLETLPEVIKAKPGLSFLAAVCGQADIKAAATKMQQMIKQG